MSTDGKLDQLDAALLKTLLERVQGGQASAADLQVARMYLRDRGWSPNPSKGDARAESLAAAMNEEDLPTFN